MRLMKCLLAEGSLSYGEYSRPLGAGVIVDLDEVVGRRRTAHGDEEPVIIEDLLAGEPGLLHAFVPVEEPTES